jgi:hypothetical protein
MIIVDRTDNSQAHQGESSSGKDNANQEKTDATRREIRAGKELLKEEMLAQLDAHHERMMARTNSQLEKMEACLGKTKAMDLETNPEETESEVEHEEVPKEDTAVETFEALKERYRDQHLAVRRCNQLKKRTPGNGGPGRSWQLPKDG